MTTARTASLKMAYALLFLKNNDKEVDSEKRIH
jgi:hypothetical protein